MGGGGGLDVDLIAGELGGQTGVLALLADGQRELVVGHHHAAALAALQGQNGEDVGGGEGGGHILGGVVAIFNNVDLLAAQLGDHVVHAGALGAYAGADGVHVLVGRPDGQLGAAARLAGDGADLHGAVVNFRHLQLEQALDQAGVGAGDEDLGPAAGAADLHHIDLQAVALVGHLAPDLLGGGEVSVGGFAVAGDAQGDGPVPGIHAGDGTHQHLMLLGAEHVVDHAVLGFPHALDDDLPGRLGGDAAEVPGLDLDADHVAALGGGQALAGLGQGDLGGGVRDFLYDLLLDVHPHGLGDLVGLHEHVVGHALVVPLVGGDQGLGDLLQHVVPGDALLFLDQGDGGKEFLAVQLIAFRCFLRCFFCHDF